MKLLLDIIHEEKDTPIPYFRENRLIRVDAHTLDAMDDTAFNERAYSWRGRGVILRNCGLFDEVPHDHQERSKP